MTGSRPAGWPTGMRCPAQFQAAAAARCGNGPPRPGLPRPAAGKARPPPHGPAFRPCTAQGLPRALRTVRCSESCIRAGQMHRPPARHASANLKGPATSPSPPREPPFDDFHRSRPAAACGPAAAQVQLIELEAEHCSLDSL
jgi:hypothetical protein